MSPIFNLRIHKKILISTKFLLKFFTIFPFFLHNLTQVPLQYHWISVVCSIFLSPMLLKRLVTWKLLSTRKADRRLLRTWLSMLLRIMITHLLFALCIKITFWTLMSLLFFTFLSMSSCILSIVHNSTIFTLDFLVSVKSRHYLKKIETLEMFQN